MKNFASGEGNLFLLSTKCERTSGGSKTHVLEGEATLNSINK